jgi:arylsulfatase A-like enzyme
MPHEIGVDHNNLPIAEGVLSSGDLLRAVGYRTAYAGKWHLPDVYPTNGIRGFESLNRAIRKGRLAVDVDQDTLTAALEFLKTVGDTPFYLVVSFINPHDICLLALRDQPLWEEVAARYMPREARNLPPIPNAAAPSGLPLPGLAGRRDWPTDEWLRYRYAYFRMVEEVDRQIGQLLDALESAGLASRTLVVFTSDHGEGMGAHGWTGKNIFYEESLRVPLIVSMRGAPWAGRVDRDTLVSTIDYLPTVCDFAGAQIPLEVRGQSLRPVIEGRGRLERPYIVSEMVAAPSNRSFTVISKRYKYVLWNSRAGTCELLFDLEQDPGEMRNLAEQADLASVLEEHRGWLRDWRTATREETYSIQRPTQKVRAKRRR